MFYLRELFFRLQYIFFSFFTTLILFYFYKHLLIFLLTVPLSCETSFNGFQHFIYTHPTELLTIYFNTILLFSTFLASPYISWQILDFFKSSFLYFEYKKIRSYLTIINVWFCVMNFFCFFTLFPNIWFFFEYFNNSVTSSLFTFFFELRVQEYFLFILFFTYLINTALIFLLLLFYLMLFFGVKKVLYFKKFIILFNVIIATFLSTPDITSQLTILFFLTFFSEFLIFSFLFLWHKNLILQLKYIKKK